MAHRRSLLGVSLCVTVVAAVSCNDPTTLPIDPDAGIVPSAAEVAALTGSEPGIDGPEQFARFGVDVAISIDGPMRPGELTRYRVTVTPTAEYESLSVDVYSPEIDFARRTGWDASYQVLRGEIAGLEHRDIGAASRARPIEIAGEVRIESAGAYELIVETRGEPIDDGPLRVLPFSHHSVWLYVDDVGGVVSNSFDRSLFPEGVIEIPGPRRQRSAPHGVSGPQGQPAAGFSTNTAKVHLYYAEGLTNYDVVGSQVQIDELDGSFNVIDTECGVTDSTGTATIVCDEFYLDVYPHLWGTEVSHLAFGGGAVSGVCTSPTVTHSISVSYTLGRAFMKLEHEIIPDIETIFGKGRSTVNLAAGTGTGLYSSFYDRISVNSVGAGSDFTLAHEFGHAWMEKAAGGNANSGQCSGDHYWDADSGYRCAVSEGFAGFVALLVGLPPDTTYTDASYLDDVYTDNTRTPPPWIVFFLERKEQ